MAVFAADLTYPRSVCRIKAAEIDGAASGVGSPPSFFLLDGKEVRVTTPTEFRQTFADAAARQSFYLKL